MTSSFKGSRRRSLALAASLLAFGATGSYAQTSYPNRPIKLIVPFAAGAATDLIGRVVGQRLSERLGQPVVVENKTGAGGMIGMQATAKSLPDGYTLGLVISTLATAAPDAKKHGFSLDKDLTGVSLISQMPVIIVAHPSASINSFQDLLQQSKMQKDGLGYSTSGIGSMSHLVGELVKYKTSAQLLHIPYRGGAPALQASLAGDVPLQLAMPTTVAPYVLAGKLKGIAVSSRLRSDVLPDVPTFGELGLKDLETTEWYGLVAPAGTPPSIINKLSAQVALILKEPEVLGKLKGMFVVGNSPEAFNAFISDERSRWASLVKSANLKIDE